MSYISEIFTRLNFQNLREFILTGEVGADIHNLSYEDRLENEMKPILTRLESLIPDEHEFDDAYSDLNQALCVHEEVYMEIGMKVGARLLYELLITENNSLINRKMNNVKQ